MNDIHRKVYSILDTNNSSNKENTRSGLLQLEAPSNWKHKLVVKNQDFLKFKSLELVLIFKLRLIKKLIGFIFYSSLVGQFGQILHQALSQYLTIILSTLFLSYSYVVTGSIYLGNLEFGYTPHKTRKFRNSSELCSGRSCWDDMANPQNCACIHC